MIAPSQDLAAWRAGQTVAQFYHRLDNRDYAACAALFTADGRWRRLGVWIDGREAIATALARRSPAMAIRHLLCNQWVESCADGVALVRAYVVAHIHMFDGGVVPAMPSLRAPTGIWTLTTRLVADSDGGWRIAEHDSDQVMARD